MGNMKIYTRTGDQGKTALFGGGRVEKSHPRVQAYGTVDELNSFLGSALPAVASVEIRDRLSSLQHDLFAVGANLATPPKEDGAPHPHVPPLPVGRIPDMEKWMDDADEELPPLRSFILPGGTQGAAALHLCRTVCRRAEREVVELSESLRSQAGSNPPSEEGAQAAQAGLGEIIRYLNRLSDLFFTLSRLENRRAGVPDVEWRKEGASTGEGGE
jgi:cob(I)alamin adenosyltransferase